MSNVDDPRSRLHAHRVGGIVSFVIFGTGSSLGTAPLTEKDEGGTVWLRIS